MVFWKSLELLFQRFYTSETLSLKLCWNPLHNVNAMQSQCNCTAFPFFLARSICSLIFLSNVAGYLSVLSSSQPIHQGKLGSLHRSITLARLGRWWTQVVDDSLQGSRWLSNHSARPGFWQGCGGLIISPQKCSVMPLIGFNLVSYSFDLRLHLLFASLSKKLLWGKTPVVHQII